jgi:hypothetical protein
MAECEDKTCELGYKITWEPRQIDNYYANRLGFDLMCISINTAPDSDLGPSAFSFASNGSIISRFMKVLSSVYL